MNIPSEGFEKKDEVKIKNQNVLKNRIGALKDAALIVALFTGLSYFITTAYKIGYSNYYQIEDIASIEIGPSDLSLIISTLNNYITGAGFLYFALTCIFVIFNLFNNNYLINPIAITFSLFTIISILYTGELNIYRLLTIIIGLSVFIVVKNFTKSKDFKNVPLIPKIHRNFYTIKITLFSKWKEAGFFKWITIGLILTLFFEAFYNLGSRDAEDKENYLIIKQNNSVYVLIEKKKDTFIIAPVQLEKRYIVPNYLIIEGESNMKNPLKFERIRIKGGLNVK
ncbi:hypothetical protein [Peribacillus muralis]|uniref:hypothetical protein n=1 Tax=Peribacillus muralis TaxID=264697 RepID=UPI000709C4CA|nr:hypothetical protein [Peribacillus muralis]